MSNDAKSKLQGVWKEKAYLIIGVNPNCPKLIVKESSLDLRLF
jgi:hypothetical protein